MDFCVVQGLLTHGWLRAGSISTGLGMLRSRHGGPAPASCDLVLSELLAHLLLMRFLLLLLRSSSRMTPSLLNFVSPARQGHLTAPNAVLSRLPRGGRLPTSELSTLN